MRLGSRTTRDFAGAFASTSNGAAGSRCRYRGRARTSRPMSRYPGGHGNRRLVATLRAGLTAPNFQLRRTVSSAAARYADGQNRDVHLVSTPADRRLEGGVTPAALVPAC